MTELLPSWLVLIFIFLFPLLLLYKFFFSATITTKKPTVETPELPGTYPLLGSFLSLRAHTTDRLDWLTTLLRSSPTSTIAARHPLCAGVHLITANPANLEHILKTKFSSYPKGTHNTCILSDLLGGGIFSVDGHEWKFQRQTISYEFSTKSLRIFVKNVVDNELNSRLIPLLKTAAKTRQILDLQDILRRFAFDNICKITFGHDPECLLPSLPYSEFAEAFGMAAEISGDRFKTFFPLLWRVKRFLNIGSERQLCQAVSLVRDFARNIAKQKIDSISKSESNSGFDVDDDLLSRFIIAGQNNETFLIDTVINFILAGRDTTSAALTWFFWLISKHPRVEQIILDEIAQIDHLNSTTKPSNSFDEIRREMIYTQAALFESMRLYQPVPVDTKQAIDDDKWPDGTIVVAGTTLSYHVYAMGRMERIWGEDWAEYKPERWLREKEGEGGVVRLEFVSMDPYSYPVFQAGPRICLGKEMAVLQMKRVVSGILKNFRVVPAVEDGVEPIFVPGLTSRMEGGFPVNLVKRN